ncbi:MAG: hypothetical protein RL138_789 [Bacteroidota bacterium]
MKRIVIIGTGNVATRLAKALHKTAYEVVQICGRTPASVRKLAKQVDAKACTDFSKIESADLYVVAVKDDAIATLAKELKHLKTIAPKAIIVHNSGSVASTVLKVTGLAYGVLYPLQSLKKQVAIDFFHVPFGVTGDSPKTRKVLHELARNLSKQTFVISDEQRMALHIAAIFANNFTHYMLVQAQQLCKEHKLQWDLLFPLIEHTFKQARQADLALLQTGPASRKDEQTMKSHVAFLKKHNKEQEKVYQLISAVIGGKY